MPTSTTEVETGNIDHPGFDKRPPNPEFRNEAAACGYIELAEMNEPEGHEEDLSTADTTMRSICFSLIALHYDLARIADALEGEKQ